MFPETRKTRNRRSKALSALSRETALTADDFILPLFIVEGMAVEQPVASMPGVSRLSIDRAATLVKKIHSKAVLLFGVVAEDCKDESASAATYEDSLVSRAVRAVKQARPDIAVITDVCVCAYTPHGHCGVLSKGNQIDNDSSLSLLAAMALSHARAGADMVAPSAMMDGQVRAIREALDEAGFCDTAIMSYAAKFASAFYGPFRDAAGSSPSFGDRSAYQINPANAREALDDALLDEQEGADWLMVKPAIAYLDVLAKLRTETRLPLAAYQVSGEYSMIKAAAAAGVIDEKKVAMESVMAMKRAGADAVITYYAEEMIEWLRK
ncbi:MAG: porphobilinogen synthase [Phycisphaerae bacterium]